MSEEDLRAAARDVMEHNLYRPPVSESDAKSKVQHGPGAAPLPEEARLEGQNYAVLALLSPMNRGASRRVLTSIRGVFETQRAAERYINEVLYPADPDVDHFVVSMWQWGFLPPSSHHVARMDTTYHDPEIQAHMEGYFASIKRDKENIKRRKKAAIKQARDNKMGRNVDEQTRKERRAAARRERAKALWKPDAPDDEAALQLDTSEHEESDEMEKID
jgi:hypothetical protein